MNIISPPHVALIPGAGIGHLTPFFRLASMLLARNCILTLITPKTTISSAESNLISSFLATNAQIRHVTFDIIPPDPSSPSGGDPFFVQYEALSRSVHRVLPQLSSASPPVSAVFCDFLVTRSIAAVCKELCVPFYTVSTTSARFMFYMLHLPVLLSRPENKIKTSCDMVKIPGLPPWPMSSIPLPFLNPNHILGANIVANATALNEAEGVLVNTFEWFEQDTLDALNSGKVSNNLPPVFAVGPLKTYELERDQTQCLQWLDQQPMNSVIYVSFGSRTAMMNDQIIELRNGLERSGCKFLWVLKTSIIDKEDKEDVITLLGHSFLERTKSMGLVLKGWVNQQEVLAHRAIAGFVSHCGWNSVVEAAERGVPVLAWPQHGDQRANAEIVAKSGLGIWERTWVTDSKGLVKEDEIAKTITALMEDEIGRGRAKKVAEEARNANKIGGSSEQAVSSIIRKLGRSKSAV